MTPPGATPQLRSLTWLRAALAATLLAFCVLGPVRPVAAAPNSIEQPDVGGQYTSLKLNGSLPVISHFDPSTGKLKIVQCGNADCSAANAIVAPNAMSIAVAGLAHTSLVLTGGVPVVSHYDAGPKDLKFVHCGTAACTSPTLRTLDAFPPTDNSGIFGSMSINGSGNPVIAYYYEPTDILRVLTCNDATCSSYGIEDVDTGTGTLTGQMPSMVLDGSGFPVVSYYNSTNGDLKLARCSNAACSSATIQVVDGASPPAQVGKYSSLALDSSGNPVISYYHETNGDLKLVHCGDATCSTNNTFAVPDGAGTTGQHTSLALDAVGNPVVGYYSVTDTALKVLHCGNVTCTASNSVVTPDGDGTVGQYASLALDASGYPVISYYDATASKLNVLHCGDAACVGTPSGVGGLTELPDVKSPVASGGQALRWFIVAAGAISIGLALVVGAWRKYPV